ncbi:hypothetical protein DPMN_129571 [Dreissena polymorpha]|uniref:Uncharacterized protein n=1 Tax=Dreissena polymorpha TaxID=45954 RepID=A0A9D4JXH6_DREPO|nr:hypothetical protein DPMN_129571 [Dreissena polymorpha]
MHVGNSKVKKTQPAATTIAFAKPTAPCEPHVESIEVDATTTTSVKPSAFTALMKATVTGIDS